MKLGHGAVVSAATLLSSDFKPECVCVCVCVGVCVCVSVCVSVCACVCKQNYHRAYRPYLEADGVTGSALDRQQRKRHRLRFQSWRKCLAVGETFRQRHELLPDRWSCGPADCD